MTPTMTRFTSPSPICFVSAAAINRERRPRRREISNPTSEARVMMPKPPTWIIAAMATWPKPDQYTGVSTTISPVTHTALVAVNKAVSSGAEPGPSRAIGSINRPVPTATATANAATIT